MIDYEKTGSFIQSRRKSMGITQEELGERLGVTAQSVSNWERGESLPETSLLLDLALILDSSVDEILGGGSSAWIYRRRITVEKMQNAIRCIKQLGELLGHNHFMYRTMVDALDAYMNSSVEEAFTGEKALDAYVCEAILECVKHGDHIDVADIKRNIRAEKAREYTLKALEEAGIR